MTKHKILKQKVYHDGTSMIVLKQGDEHAVPPRLVQTWIDEGVIGGKTSKELARAPKAPEPAPETELTSFVVVQIPGGRFSVRGPEGFKRTFGTREEADAFAAEKNGPAAEDEAPIV